MTRCVIAILLLTFAAAAQAAPEQKPAPAQTPAPFKPHYVSQRPDKAYLREGPAYAHKVLWIYRHKGYPFLVTASFDVWRRVRDVDGTTGWMSAQMLSDSRTVLVTGKDRVPIHATDDPGSKVVGLADPGAILGLKACVMDACRAYAERVDGWIVKSRIWGVGADEVFK